MPVVRVPTVLRKHTDGEAKVSVDGATVGEAFEHLVDGKPELREQLFDGETLRGFVNVYVDDEDIRYLDGLETKVDPGEEIAIMPAVAGGAEAAVQPSTHGAMRVAGGAEAAVQPSTHGAMRFAGGAEAAVQSATPGA